MESTWPTEMNASPPVDGRRKLVYLPIIHTAADMGTLSASIRGRKLPVLGRQGLAHHAAVVEQMWKRIEDAAARLPLTKGTWRIYQDGLPVCGHEREIVAELAAAGSRNYQLLLRLEARGATLMGTESPELLVEEYQLATATFASSAARQTETSQQNLRDSLLLKRDRFVADRVNRTLGTSERGILFMGMLHTVSAYLDADICVEYPLGQPKISQRRPE